MDFNYSPQEEEFRQELREWLNENMKELPKWWFDKDLPRPDINSDERHQFDIWWHQKLYDAGYMGIAWPKEYGGRGATVLEQVVYQEEMAMHRAPTGTNAIGIGWCGPTIIAAGTEEQKQRFLRPMLRAEEIWCQGFSEPEAGSDMANVQTRAVEDGDDFVVNGQKVWTSGGHYCDWAILLVRTDPDAPKHRGISYLVLDMHAPGVEVRPLRQITGHAEFNEVFMDNVRIPKKWLVGELNRGWYVAMGTLEFERSGSGAAIRRETTVLDLIELVKQTTRNGEPLSKDPLVRQKLAQYYVEANVLRFLGLRNLTSQLRGQRPGPEGSVGHVMGVEFNQSIQDFALQVEGLYGTLMRGSKYAIDQGSYQYSFLRARGNSIETGTSEIQRNVVAQRALGLPR